MWSTEATESLDLSWCLHVGQEEWDRSHLSMQVTWYLCAQLGNTRILSPFEKSTRQIAQAEVDVDGAEFL